MSQRKQKKYCDLKHTQRTTRKRNMESAFKTVCAELHPEIKQVKVELSFDEGQVMSFFPRKEVNENDNSQLTWQKKAEHSSEHCRRVLAIQDKYRISQEALHEIHMLGTVVPSRYYIDQERERMSSVLPLLPVPGVDDCTRRTLQDILEYVINEQEVEHNHLLLRFACDGAKLTKKINSVRGVFKIMHPRDRLPTTINALSMSPEDELTLYFYIGDENRITTEATTKDTFREMKSCSENGIEVNNTKITTEWILTCDWKALTILKGINSANSEYFCMWCYCTKAQICDFTVPSWDIQRCTDDQTRYLNGTTGRGHGYIKPDLVSFIDYTNVVPDDLHLRIRITLKLFNQVVTWAIDQNNEENLQREMKRIGVAFHFWEEQSDEKNGISVKKWSQPSGDDLKKIVKGTILTNILEERPDRHLVHVESLTVEQLKDELENLGLSQKGKKGELVLRLRNCLGAGVKIVPRTKRKSRLQVTYAFSDDHEDNDDRNNPLDIGGLQQLWSDFGDLMDALSALPESAKYMEPNQFMQNARTWAQDFRKLTFDEDVTPYIHTMVYHVPYFLAKYRYLHDIGVSQVERKNYDHRQAYFGSTNRGGGKSQNHISMQILQRENRMLYAKTEKCLRTKRPYKQQTKE